MSAEDVVRDDEMFLYDPNSPDGVAVSDETANNRGDIISEEQSKELSAVELMGDPLNDDDGFDPNLHDPDELSDQGEFADEEQEEGGEDSPADNDVPADGNDYAVDDNSESLDAVENHAQLENDNSHGVPSARFQQVVAHKNDLIRQNQELQAKLDLINSGVQLPVSEPRPQVPEPQLTEADIKYQEFDIDSKIREFTEATSDGFVNEAEAIQKEINGYHQYMANKEARKVFAEMQAEQDRQRQNQDRQRQVQEASATVYEIIDRHPELKQDDVVTDFKLFRDSYLKRGHSLKDAVLKAEERLFGKAPEPSKEKQTRKTNIAQNATTARSQPPRQNANGRGHRQMGNNRTAMDYNDKEYARLAPSQKARERGDII